MCSRRLFWLANFRFQNYLNEMMTKETNLQRLEDEAALAGMEQAGTQLSDKGECWRGELRESICILLKAPAQIFLRLGFEKMALFCWAPAS